MKPHQVIICGFLLGLIILSGLSSPTIIQSAFTNAESTPAPEQEKVKGELPLESGDTMGLIIGAVVIVLIILGGVLISRTMTYSSLKNTE